MAGHLFCNFNLIRWTPCTLFCRVKASIPNHYCMKKVLIAFGIGLMCLTLVVPGALAQGIVLVHNGVDHDTQLALALKKPVKKKVVKKKVVKKIIKKKVLKPKKPVNKPLVVPPPAQNGTSTPPISRPSTDVPLVPAPVTVNILNFAFAPTPLTVKKGTTVTFINKDSAPHTVTPSDVTSVALTDFGSDILSNGQSYSYTFTKAGTWNYFCGVHPSMVGAVTVEE